MQKVTIARDNFVLKGFHAIGDHESGPGRKFSFEEDSLSELVLSLGVKGQLLPTGEGPLDKMSDEDDVSL